MHLGVAYYPEQWPKAMLHEDLDRIVEMGANSIRIGEFAWHMMEKTPGQYDFSFFDQVVAEAQKRGLSVVFGTPTATFPAWLAKAYPEILAMNADGTSRVFGGRRQYCFNSEVYRTFSERIVGQLVSHFADQKHLTVWQVDNEFGHEGSDVCFCPKCHRAFQVYLKDHYQTIDVLNETYGTIFWGQTYNDFQEIPMPLATITTHNPLLKLDWSRFRSYSLNTFARGQIDVIAKNKGKHQTITHNFFGGYFDRQYDQNDLSESLDFVSFDNYPVWGGLDEPIEPAEIALAHDYMRGLKQKNFWILEQLIGAQGHDAIGYLPRPNQAIMWATQAMARGCEALYFFRYRGFNKGQEQYCQGILDPHNDTNDKFEDAKKFFKTIKDHEAHLMSEIKAEIALLYDYDNRWSWHGQVQSSTFDYTQELLRHYRNVHALNLPIDVLAIQKDFSKYKLVLLPAMQMIDQGLAKRLETYVAAGGTLIVGFRTGTKDRDNNLHFGMKAPGYLRDLTGVQVAQYEALGHHKSVAILKEGHQVGVGTVWRDLLIADQAKVLMSYDAPYDQYAAVTHNAYGKGNVYYIGSGLDKTSMHALYHRIIEDIGLPYIHTPEGLEVIKRVAEGKEKTFVMNHTSHEQVFEGRVFAPYACDIL